MIAPTPWHEGDGVTLYQGDCLHILPHLAAETFDVLLTDPPYSSGGLHQSDRNQATGTKYVQTGTRIARPDFQGDNRDQRSFTLWATLWLSYCLPLLRPGRPALIFTDWRQLPSTTDALQAAGFVWRGVIPWDKGRGVRPMNGWSAQAEYVVWGTRGPVDLGHGPVYLDGHLTAPVRQAEKHHQTGKPVGMLEQLLRIAPPHGRVLDPFAGSGSTLVAAQRHGLQGVGIEIEPAYLQVTANRLREPALFAAGGEGVTGD